MAELSSTSRLAQDAAIVAAVSAALSQMGITSTSSTTLCWEPGSIKIQSPTLLRTDNYALWRVEAQIHLDNAGVYVRKDRFL